MSLDSLRSRDFYGGAVGHQLSATRLLSSPEASSRSHRPLDIVDGYERSWTWTGGRDSRSSLNHATRSSPYFAFSGCFRGCNTKIKQAFAKRKVEQGVKLYDQHKQTQAVKKWKSALKALKKREDKFALLGYLYQAYMDWGKYREAMEYGHRQLYIAEELDNAALRSESHLNLARCHQRIGSFEQALAYARHSLYDECERCSGHVHLTVGAVYLELAGFHRALDGFQRAHRVAQAARDSSLELQVYVGLSELFNRLQDPDNSARYASKAYDLSRSLQLGDLNSRHHRAALLQMASSLRKQGELGDAQDYCSEATRLALMSGDQATYARSIRIMGDIYRKKNEINKAFRQYEQAMAAAAAMGDRVIQMESMDGAARCLEALRIQKKICNCRPLEFNSRLLEVAHSVGSKLLIKTIRSRLSKIYRSLGDHDQQKHQDRVISRLEDELNMVCGACGLKFGEEKDVLDALQCGHLLHARCSYEIMRGKGKKRKKTCPECDKTLNSRLNLTFFDDFSPQQSLICSENEDNLSFCGSFQATSSV